MNNEHGWVETDAVVTSCRFQFARLNTLRLGFQTGERFRIGFKYFVLRKSYAAEFWSPVAVPQGERLKVSYNPRRPEENSRSDENSGLVSGRGSLLALGVGGSVVLSIIWLEMLRGCR